ncbi:histidine phosphatase superfamily [Hypoxylon sp. NC1633]|nr:histidine phosphatase superfamily [Hypoxylon sp. NC1633]
MLLNRYPVRKFNHRLFVSPKLNMSSSNVASSRWVFTRPDPPSSQHQFFKSDLRQIAGREEGFDLPWRDDMYLAYPSPDAPSWPAFLDHIQQLNAEADANTQYKIVYVMRRAHKARQEPDPVLDDEGQRQCTQLAENLGRAARTALLPPPEVIVTSPLARALETTHLGIAPAFPSVRPIVLESLREGLTGTPKNERHGKSWIKEKFPTFNVDNVDDFDQLGARYSSPDRKESYEALSHRVQGALGHVFENFPGASVVLVMSHCYVQQTIQREITGWDVPDDYKKEAVEFFVGEAGGYAIVVKGIKY